MNSFIPVFLLAILFIAPSQAMAADEIENLVAEINQRIEKHRNYEIKLIREGSSGAREDHYVRKHQYYMHSFTQKDGSEFKSVAHFTPEGIWEFQSGRVRKSSLSELSYNRLALGEIRHRSDQVQKANKKIVDGKIILKLTFHNGFGKEYLIDPDTLIVLRRRDLNPKNEVTFTVERKFINLQPTYTDDYFTSYIEATKTAATKTVAKKQKATHTRTGVFFITVLLSIILTSFVFIRSYKIQTVIGKTVVFATFFASFGAVFFALMAATKGYLSMLLSAITWKQFQHLDPQLYAFVSSFIQGLILAAIAMLPSYLLFSLLRRIIFSKKNKF